MQITFEQASICPYCFDGKGSNQTQTSIRVLVEGSSQIRCGTCGWILPHPVKLTVPASLVGLIRFFLERCRMTLSDPLNSATKWNHRFNDETDSCIRLQTPAKEVFCQVVWIANYKEPDYELSSKYEMPAELWRELVKDVSGDLSPILAYLAQEEYLINERQLLKIGSLPRYFHKIIDDTLLVVVELTLRS